MGALWHYEKVLVAGSGTLGDAYYTPPQYDDRLLIGTNGYLNTTDAMLVILEKSGLSEAGGARLVSQVSYPDIFPEEVILATGIANTS